MSAAAAFTKKQERFPRLIIQLLISYLTIVSLGVSVNSLSSFYRRHNDVGLCEYINRVRIR